MVIMRLFSEWCRFETSGSCRAFPDIFDTSHEAIDILKENVLVVTEIFHLSATTGHDQLFLYIVFLLFFNGCITQFEFNFEGCHLSRTYLFELTGQLA